MKVTNIINISKLEFFFKLHKIPVVFHLKRDDYLTTICLLMKDEMKRVIREL